MKKLKEIGFTLLIVASMVGSLFCINQLATANASPGCDQVLWGFLGSQRRTICDGPLRPDGSWQRARVVWTPAHQVPFSCYYSRYSSTCSGGYFVPETKNSEEVYVVFPDNVLQDEPGYLGNALASVAPQVAEDSLYERPVTLR